MFSELKKMINEAYLMSKDMEKEIKKDIKERLKEIGENINAYLDSLEKFGKNEIDDK